MLVEEWCYNSCFSASGHRANLFTLSYTCELTSNSQPGKGLVVFVVMTFPLVCSGDSAEAVWPDPLHWLTWKSAASENEGSEASTQSWTTFTTKEGNSQQKIPTVLTRSSSILTLTMSSGFVLFFTPDTWTHLKSVLRTCSFTFLLFLVQFSPTIWTENIFSSVVLPVKTETHTIINTWLQTVTYNSDDSRMLCCKTAPDQWVRDLQDVVDNMGSPLRGSGLGCSISEQQCVCVCVTIISFTPGTLCSTAA